MIPLVYLLPKLLPWGAIAVFLSEPISDLIGGTASYLAMRASVWKELCRLEALEPSHGPGFRSCMSTFPGCEKGATLCLSY